MQDGSIYLETRVSKRTSLDFGLISRTLRRTVLEFAPDDLIFHDYTGNGLLTRIEYKVYFSKSKTDLKGWYYGVFNRNEFGVLWDKGYKEKFDELGKDDPYAFHPVQSVEIGLTFGAKKVFKNNVILFFSVGYSFELLELFGFTDSPIRGITLNPLAKFGFGYRFKGKNNEEVQE